MNLRLSSTASLLVLLVLLAASAARLAAATSVLVTGGVLRDAVGHPLPDGALVVLVASTVDATFAPPTPGALLQAGATLVGDDVVLATWTVDSTRTGVAGAAFHVVNFDYSRGWIHTLNAGDPLMLYWFPAATHAHPAAAPGASYGSYRADAISSGSTLNWIAPTDGDGATFELNFLTTAAGGDLANVLANATQTVALPVPDITSHPADGLAALGHSATLTVVAHSQTLITYQWQKNGENISGATDSSYTLHHLVPGDAGSYAVVITNVHGSMTSTSAVLTPYFAAPSEAAVSISVE